MSVDPTPAPRRPLPFIAIATAVLVCRMAVALVLVPPWQMADEQAHVAYTEVLRNRLLGVSTPNPGREDEIIASMVQAEWWQHYYWSPVPQPPLPQRFLDTNVHNTIGVISERSQLPRLYYAAVAAGLSVFPRMSVTVDLYVMRLLSAALGILTLFVGWRGARESGFEGVAATVAALIAVHPQFAIASTSAGPDAFVNLAGAFLWWQTIRLLNGGAILVSLLAIWATAVVTTFADRMGMTLLGAASMATLSAVVQRGASRKSVWAAAAAAVATLVVVLRSNELLWQQIRVIVRIDPLFAPSVVSWDFVATFHRVLFTSWWLSLGWARYLPPTWWVMLALILSAAAVFGLTRLFLSRDRLSVAVRVALLMVSVQAAAIYWVFFRHGVGPQGRHLFPILVPTLLLLCAGWDHCVPPSWRPRARAALVAAVFALDVAGWLFLAIPVYGRGARPDRPPIILAGHALDFQRVPTPEITGEVHVGEVFTMHSDGLTAIDVRPVRIGEPRGALRLQIGVGVPPALPAVHTADVPADVFARSEVFRFVFGPFDNSKNQRYVFDIGSSPDAPSSGVALWATRNEGNPDDGLLFNGRDRFGDLVYQTVVAVPPRDTPPLHRRVWFALAVLIVAAVLVPRLLDRIRHPVN